MFWGAYGGSPDAIQQNLLQLAWDPDKKLQGYVSFQNVLCPIGDGLCHDN